MNYWDRASEMRIKAKEHTDLMTAMYGGVIEECTNLSTFYGHPNRAPFTGVSTEKESKQYVIQDTTVGALFRLKQESCGKVALLNFASYTNPGGKFIEGSMAQEESLCHASFLFNVLSGLREFYNWNNTQKNRGIYTDRAIYSPNVLFIDEHGKCKHADVLTCAAPNRSLIEKYKAFSEDENKEALAKRVLFVRDICVEQHCDTVVLGAWGCGVFRQSPEAVATLFKEAFESTGMTVIYACPEKEVCDIFRNVCGM